MTKTGPITFRAKVEGLQQLIAGGRYYNSNSNEGKIAHPDNWWGIATALNGLIAVADFYASEYPEQLPYNDISLPWGGKFDGNAHNWTGGHTSHRWGADADVNTCDFDPVKEAYVENLFLTSGIGNASISVDECDIPSIHTWHFRW